MPPGFVWSKLVPELLVSDLATSLAFWRDLCGFAIAYERPEEGFAYLDRGGVQVMLEAAFQPGRRWITGALERPFGRGINLQIEVATLAPILDALAAASWPIYLGEEEKWYRAGTAESGVRQFLVQDPDGYLLRFQQNIGLRQACSPAT